MSAGGADALAEQIRGDLVSLRARLSEQRTGAVIASALDPESLTAVVTYCERVDEAAAALHQIVGELDSGASRERGSLQADSLQAALTADAMQAETDALEQYLATSANGEATHAHGRFKGPQAILSTLGFLKALIKRISNALWRLLARLVTVKEWKLKGDLSTGPFNLANAGVEITFG